MALTDHQPVATDLDNRVMSLSMSRSAYFATVLLLGCSNVAPMERDANVEQDASNVRDSASSETSVVDSATDAALTDTMAADGAATDATTADGGVTDARADAAPSCQGVVPIGGLTLQTSFRISRFQQGNAGFPDGPITVTTFAPFFGERWPARTQNRTLAVGIGKFMALEFNTGTVSVATYGERPAGSGMVNRYGTLQWVPPSEAAGRPLVVISECPGDFVNLPENNPHCRNFVGRVFDARLGRRRAH